MATASGVTGTVTFTSGYVTNVKAWTLDYSADMLDITDYSSTGPRAFVGGLTSWRGTYTCNYDATAIVIAPGATAAQIVLTALTGQTFTGNAILESAALSASVDGLPEVVCTFQGTAALTPA